MLILILLLNFSLLSEFNETNLKLLFDYIAYFNYITNLLIIINESFHNNNKLEKISPTLLGLDRAQFELKLSISISQII